MGFSLHSLKPAPTPLLRIDLPTGRYFGWMIAKEVVHGPSDGFGADDWCGSVRVRIGGGAIPACEFHIRLSARDQFEWRGLGKIHPVVFRLRRTRLDLQPASELVEVLPRLIVGV